MIKILINNPAKPNPAQKGFIPGIEGIFIAAAFALSSLIGCRRRL